MMTVNLILTIVGLLFLLIGLVALYVWSSKKKTPSHTTPATIETFESLSAIIKNSASSASELNRAINLILERFSTINTHTISNYKHLLQALCTHPKTDSKLILKFEKTLRTKNPDYADEIERALAIGLAARG